MRYGILFCTVALAAYSTVAGAQKYPDKPLRMIVPFAPGGGTDIVARRIAQKLTEGLGQQVVVDNRGGAGGVLGADLAARAAPDGYTIILVSGSYAVNPSLYKLAYDPLKDFAPVSQVAVAPNILVVHNAVPAKNVQELIERNKRFEDAKE